MFLTLGSEWEISDYMFYELPFGSAIIKWLRTLCFILPMMASHPWWRKQKNFLAWKEDFNARIAWDRKNISHSTGCRLRDKCPGLRLTNKSSSLVKHFENLLEFPRRAFVQEIDVKMWVTRMQLACGGKRNVSPSHVSWISYQVAAEISIPRAVAWWHLNALILKFFLLVNLCLTSSRREIGFSKQI